MLLQTLVHHYGLKSAASFPNENKYAGNISWAIKPLLFSFTDSIFYLKKIIIRSVGSQVIIDTLRKGFFKGSLRGSLYTYKASLKCSRLGSATVEFL